MRNIGRHLLVFLAACILAASPTLAQSQAAKTGTGGVVAGQDLPVHVVPLELVIAGGVGAIALGAALAISASDDAGGSGTAAGSASLSTVTTSTTR